jgi:HlyD family secretion protein
MNGKKLAEKDHQNRHSEEVHEIITAVPSWLLRAGITVMVLGTALIIILALIIHYPETVSTQLKISSSNLSKAVKVRSSGRLIKLLVKDDSYVRQGATLAYLESTADHARTLQLLVKLRLLQKQLPAHLKPNFDPFFFTGATGLGEVQNSFEQFIEAYDSYVSGFQRGYYVQKRAYLKNDLCNITRQLNKLQAQKLLSQRSAFLAGDDFAMHKKLAAQHVETVAELRLQESNYLAKKSPLIQNENSIINNRMAESAIKKELLDLDKGISENSAKFEQAIGALISAIEEWKMRYTVSASQTGRLSYNGVIQENQELAAGQEIFYINPGTGHFFGMMNIPANKFGKVKAGQRVIIKLDGYPFEDYGSLQGKIARINEFSADGYPFSAYVSLPGNSDFDKRIHLKEGLPASAEIITEEATLFQRLTRAITKNTSPN